MCFQKFCEKSARKITAGLLSTNKMCHTARHRLYTKYIQQRSSITVHAVFLVNICVKYAFAFKAL